MLQTPRFRIDFRLFRKGFLKLPIEFGVGGLRAVVGRASEISGEEQRDKNQHAADRGDDVRESEEGDFGIKTSKSLSHDLASTGTGAGSGAAGGVTRWATRNFETIYEWQ